MWRMREFAVLTDDLGVGNRKIIGLLMGLLVFVALLGGVYEQERR
jgi:hypothetical protein